MKKLLILLLFSTVLNAQGLTGVVGLLNDNTDYGIDTSGASRVFFVDALYGNDAKDGLSGKTAWKTLNKVNTYGQQSGDSILFRRGQTFTNKTILNDSMSYALTIADGIPNMYFGAYGSGDKPIIDGGGLGGARYVFFYWNKTPLTTGTTTFRGINFFSPDSSSESYQGYYGGSGEFYSYETMCFEAYGLGTTVIDSCTFDGDGKSYSCMYAGNAISDTLPYKITNSIFKNAYAEHGIYITHANGSRFENNILQNLPEFGLALKYHDKDTIRYNYFDRVQALASITDMDSLLFAYNVARCDSISGGSDNGTTFYPDKVLSTIQYGINLYSTTSNARIYNNTFYIDYHQKDVIFINAPSPHSGSAEVKNNIFYVRENKDPSGSRIFIRDNSNYTITSDYNEFYTPDSSAYSTWHKWIWMEDANLYYSLLSWQDSTGNDLHSYYRDGNDTLFTYGANADYTLFTGSPAINRGVDVGETVDYLGNSIIGLPDIGAYESDTPDETDSLIYASDFSSTTNGWNASAATATANNDGISDSNDVLKFYADGSGSDHRVIHTGTGIFYSGNKYQIVIYYLIPSGQTHTNGFYTFGPSGMPTQKATSNGTWQEYKINWTAGADGGTVSIAQLDDGFGFTGANSSSDDIMYIAHVKFYKVKGLPD